MISGYEDCVHKAAAFVRSKYSLPESETIISQFQEEFNCVVILAGYIGQQPDITFHTAADELMFRLKWS